MRGPTEQLQILLHKFKNFAMHFLEQMFALLLLTGRHFWNRKCRKKTWWQQEFAVFKCEATANSVTGHVCVNSNIGSVKTGSETECENQIRRRAAGRCTSEF